MALLRDVAALGAVVSFFVMVSMVTAGLDAFL